MKAFTLTTIALVIGASLGYFGNQVLTEHDSQIQAGADTSTAANDPLYWVAPMDPNYQRDKPGKSPMGMDLIPVYANEQALNNKPGTVYIDPAVENNLGVKTAPVIKQSLTSRIDTIGYIAFDESQLWQTNVRVSGWVEQLNINAVGEQVNKGDVLFTLYSPELVKAQEELLSAYRTGRQGLITGASERLVTLGVDRAQIKQIVTQGKAQQTIAVKALASGVIASLNIREGGYISPAQTVISGGPLDQVWVDSEVFERQAHGLTAGSKAIMTLDSLPGREWLGQVDYVYPILDPDTRTLRMRVKFANQDGALKPNMFANLELQPQSSEPVLTIPTSAVIRAGGMSRVVLAEGDGKYRSARIRVGRETDANIEVLAGLTEQNTVVTSAHFMLDSESSQSAELERINGVNSDSKLTPQQDSVSAAGEITQVMPAQRMVTINHQPVAAWNWPAMIMDFHLADSVDMHALMSGQAIKFTMIKATNGTYQINNITSDDSPQISEVWVNGHITMLMADFAMLTVQHLPVDEWQWQAGEINFNVNDDISLTHLQEGDKVRLLVAKNKGEFILKQLEKIGGKQ